ncbi:DUF6010 family protein [Phaeobacter gallaeciensis]|uniref:DUF6010 family protein n=1 Tax=Phaeobacter gallaeciensis TaxID=60890 RepID=UPI00237F6AA5|nr:DUF6010 family protein [Phaeobacter gallaeciensis]MDE4099604.1 hypothetical protein [Phaeobacter gallaeciensis]MDE4108316.1 hypothetical protein [Phaeobacter gallaeciensis]MDE4112681.1 hypothetical protein [Phaeobacter gallaeciensis]MDE4117151.1 hypothetical protein [Phaeobacter gallaeciensis]MDE4121623.1 hypothetical protein [Phaeobacter gallaeciensis]
MAQIIEKTGDPASRHRHSDIMKFPVRIGAFLVLLSLPAHLFLDERTSVALASITLALIGGAYIGFGAADGNPRVFWAELAVALLFALAAFLGLIWHWAFLPLGLALHALWDILHHKSRRLASVPNWYIPFCVAFDLLAAAFFILLYGVF